MPNKIISGALTIPASEAKANGFYSDLRLELVHIIDGVETIAQTSQVSTNNTYSFTYDATVPQVRVQLIRVTTGVKLSETATRGVLPRSFKLPKTDALYVGDFKHQNYLFDAGLSVLACAGGNYTSLGKEITDGILKAKKTSGALPFKAHHVTPTGADAFLRTGTVAIAAYSLGYYLEKNPLASNKVQVADALYEMLQWLTSKRKATHGNLIIGGVGKYNGTTLDTEAEDTFASTIDNILAFFAFKQAGKVLNVVYKEVASELRSSIYDKLYNLSTKKFNFGIYETGPNVSESLELLYMGAYFLMEDESYGYAIYLMESIEAYYKAVDSINNVEGYKATKSDTKVHYEGSYAVAALWYKLGEMAKYNKIIKSINKTIDPEDGGFKYGIIKDGQYQVLTYKNVGSTAWSIITNLVPEEIFTVGLGTTLVSGLNSMYINQTRTGVFQKNDCTVGEGSTLTFKVLPGTYMSTADQATVNATADAYITANGQTYANTVGTCTIEPTFKSAARGGWFLKEDCGAGSTGVPIWYEVPLDAYGSDISQDHADALRDTKLFKQGPIEAANSWECQILPELVNLTVDSQVISDSGQDEVFATIYANKAVATFLTIDYDYTLDGGATWMLGSTQMVAGASNTSSFLVGVTPWGGGNAVLIRITNVTPGSFDRQVYTWANSEVTSYTNVEVTGKFLKTCPGQNPVVVPYTVPAGTFNSNISQNHADALAYMHVANIGFDYANSTGVCPGTLIGNDRQAQTFQVQGCAAGYEGEMKEYVVNADTYLAATKTDANDLALQDISTNGQTWVNNNGQCIQTANTIFVSVATRVESWGMNGDDVYIQVYSSEPVTTDITVRWDYELNGNLGRGGWINLMAGQSFYEEWFGQFNPSEGGYVMPRIISITPTTDGNTNYLAQ